MKIEWSDGFFTEEELRRTPERVRAFQEEWNRRGDFKFTVFDNDGMDEMVVLKDIEFYSLCSHHLLPFFGKAHVGYIPDKKICGVSKLARVVDKFASKPQVQERLTTEVVDYLEEHLKPKGVMVVMEAQHLCMLMRGVQKQGSVMMTSAIKGVFSEIPTRDEFLRLIR